MIRSALVLGFAATSVLAIVTDPPARAMTVTVQSGGQLRTAITNANGDPTITEILINTDDAILGLCGPAGPGAGVEIDNANASGDLDFTGPQNLTIRGIRTDQSSIRQDCEDRVIDHRGSGTLTLRHVELLSGQIKNVPIGTGANPIDYSGGGVRSTGGALSIDDVNFKSNSAGSADNTISSFGSTQMPGSGGGIYSTGDVTIINSRFADNAAGRGGNGETTIAPTPGGHGGAIYVDGGVLSVTNTTFISNGAGRGGNGIDLPGAPGGNGGAIYGDVVRLVDVTISDEYAGLGGQAVDAGGGDGGDGGGVYAKTSVEATRTSFTSVSPGDGGASNTNGGNVVALQQDRGGRGGNGGAINAPTITFTESFVINAEAGVGGAANGDDSNGGFGGHGGQGGGLYGDTITITRSEITKSFAGFGGDVTGGPMSRAGDGGDGGAVFVRTMLTVDRSAFIGNGAGQGGVGTIGGIGGHGGALGGSLPSIPKMTITDSSFDSNRSGNGGTRLGGTTQESPGSGGAIYNVSNARGAVDATNSTFVRNSIGSGPSTARGSAIASNNLTLTHSTVTNNVGAHAIQWAGIGPAGFDFVTASVIAENPDGNCAPSSAPRTFFTQSGGHNVEDTNTCGFGESTDRVDQSNIGLAAITEGPGASLGLGDPGVGTGPDADGVGRLPVDGGILDDSIAANTCRSGFRINAVSDDQWVGVRPSGLGCEPGALEIGVDPVPDPDPMPDPDPTPDPDPDPTPDPDPDPTPDPTPDPDPAAQLDNAARFVPLPPVRLFDTRSGEPAAGPKGLVAPDSSIDVQVTGVGGVPTSAVAVVMNVAAINSTNGGFVTIWAAGAARPLAATHNLTAPGQTRPNLVTVPIGADGKVSIYTERGAHFAGDVAGYYEDTDVAVAAGRVVSVQPSRVFDTRPTETGSPGPKGKLVAGATIDVQVTGVAGVPSAGVAAVVMNLAGINATNAGFVTAFPTGDARPLAAVLNLNAPGETNSNLVMLPVGTDGKISLYSSAGAHLSGDITAYVTDALGGVGTTGLFVPLAPTRAFDTRPGETTTPGPKGFVAADATIDGRLGIAVGIPSTASGAVLNVAGVAAGARGFVTGFPAGTARPLSATLNLASVGDVRPNAAILPIGASDSISFYSQSGVHLVVDTSGYFLG